MPFAGEPDESFGKFINIAFVPFLAFADRDDKHGHLNENVAIRQLPLLEFVKSPIPADSYAVIVVKRPAEAFVCGS